MKRAIVLVVLLLVAGSWHTADAGISVFVSIPPQQWLVRQIAGELVDIHLLVPEGRNPHTFEPTPKEVASLSRGKVWFVLGMEFEQQLLAKVRGVAPQLGIVDIAAKVPKLALTDDEHEHHHGEQPGDAPHGPVDPHVWLSPLNLQTMAVEVGGVLAKVDPVNASIYRENLDRLQSQLGELHAEISTMLAPLKGSTFYVYHPSFGYFAAAYGLHQEPVELGSKSPSPRQLARLIARAKEEQVRVIFVQPQFDSKSGEAIAAAVNGRVVPLNALAENVVANLREMATQIKLALAR